MLINVIMSILFFFLFIEDINIIYYVEVELFFEILREILLILYNYKINLEKFLVIFRF